MSNLPIITFRVDLTDVFTTGSTLLSAAEETKIAGSKSIYLPGLLAGENLTLKHGDTFTLQGAKAIYLKMLIDQGKILNIYVDGTRTVLESIEGLSILYATEDENIYTINPLTGSASLLTSISGIGEFKGIEINSINGFLYQIYDNDSSIKLKKINVNTKVAEDITLSGDAIDGNTVTAMAHDPATDLFYFGDSEAKLYKLTTSGVVTLIGTNADIQLAYSMMWHNGKLYGGSIITPYIFEIDVSDASTVWESEGKGPELAVEGRSPATIYGLHSDGTTVYFIASDDDHDGTQFFGKITDFVPVENEYIGVEIAELDRDYHGLTGDL